MRTTLTSFVVAAAVSIGGIGCKRDRDDGPNIAQKPIEAADEAAENVRDRDMGSAERVGDEMKEASEEIGSARAELREQTREAQGELTEAFGKMRDEMRQLSADSNTFTANRDRVAADVRSNIDMLDQRIAQLSARLGTLTGEDRAEADKKLSEAKALAAEARSEAQKLSTATAQTWNDVRDESLDSLERLHDKVAEVSAEIRVTD
jgi:DNA repair exonuclease SbcCD ATPase subunit